MSVVLPVAVKPRLGWVPFAFAGLFVLAALIAFVPQAEAASCGPGACYTATDGSPDLYRWIDSTDTSGRPKPSYSWTEISTSGSVVQGTRSAACGPSGAAWCLGDNDWGCQTGAAGCAPYCFKPGFSFWYYGQSRDCVFINANGFLKVDSSPGAVSPTGACCSVPAAQPDGAAPNGVIAGYWNNINPFFCGYTTTGRWGVFYQTVGVSPNRKFIVEWNGVLEWPASPSSSGCPGAATGGPECAVGGDPSTSGCTRVTFEIILYEDTTISPSSSNIEVMLKDVKTPATPAAAPTNAALGVEDMSGTRGLNYGFNNAQTFTSRAIRYFPNHAPTPGGTTATIMEDATTAVSLTLTGVDPDGDGSGTCTVTAGPSKGTLGGSGCSRTYLPNPDYCNSTGGTPDIVSFTMTDALGTAGTVAGQASITVTCVNDAPDFTIPATATFADSSAIIKPGFATQIAAGPPSAPDEATQSLKFIVTTSDPSVFSVGPVIAPAGFGLAPWSGDLGFTPVAGSCSKSPITVNVQLQDGAGTTPGAGDDLSEVKTFQLKLTCGAAPPPTTTPPPAVDGDWDRDGYLDSREIIAGSDPRNAASTPLDLDADGVPNDPALDNCPTDPNEDQLDSNGDRRGDVCQSRGALGPDADRDTVANDVDNCPTIVNLAQTDTDDDHVGDACDDDLDGDGADNNIEIAAKSSPFSAASTPSDRDGDGVVDTLDNCKDPNPDQLDANKDGVGDLCTPTRKPGLNATATYDGRRLIVSWTVAGEAQLRSVAEVMEGTTPVMASATEAGAGHKRAAFDIPNLDEVTWRVRLSDPYDPTVARVVDGKARVPPPLPPRDPAVIEQPAAAVVGNAFGVAYDLPPGTTVATLELTAPDGSVRQVPLTQAQGTRWTGAAVTPLEGTYGAALRYSLQGSQRTYDTGKLTAQAPAAAPAVQATPANLVPAVLGGLGILVLLAAIGIVTLGLAMMARKRAAARAAAEAEAAQAAEPQAEEPTIDGPGYDEPIRM